uniref:Uncharacterized protein n=1 Tax=Xiphophorus couchianus TaxID=32473 RepID=A0A3B5MUL5_9TELE
HFLSTSKEVQDKLYQELQDVLGSDPVSLDKIPQLRYCQQVLNETVRTAKLTPVAARLQEVEGKVDQHVIPKETLVIYALGVVLQDADTWSVLLRLDLGLLYLCFCHFLRSQLVSVAWITVCGVIFTICHLQLLLTKELTYNLPLG